jgi:hypothetical protein
VQRRIPPAGSCDPAPVGPARVDAAADPGPDAQTDAGADARAGSGPAIQVDIGVGTGDDAVGTGADAGDIGDELAAVVAAARRRAFRGGDRQVDTAHLLHTLLESDMEVRAVFDGGPPQVARLLGYLVQRSVGYGIGWSHAVEDSGSVPVVTHPAQVPAAPRPREGGVPRWSPAAAAAMDAALRRAGARGAPRAEGADLLACLVRDRECRAVEVLLHVGVDPEALGAALDTGPAGRRPGHDTAAS